MDIYTATMRAADFIERNPGEFDFSEVRVPEGGCGSTGCAIGWVAYFSGIALPKSGSDFNVRRMVRESNRSRSLAHTDACEPVLGVGYKSFYGRMDATGVAGWRSSAAACARALRLYAAKYLKPAQQPPDWQAMADRLASVPMLESA